MGSFAGITSAFILEFISRKRYVMTTLAVKYRRRRPHIARYIYSYSSLTLKSGGEIILQCGAFWPLQEFHSAGFVQFSSL